MTCSPSLLTSLLLLCGALSPTVYAVDIVGDGNIYSTAMGATRVGFLNPGGSSSPTTYFGMWYDAANNRGVIEALSGGVAWRSLALNSSGKQPVYIGGALGVGIATPASLGSGGNPTILQVHGTGAGQPYGLIEMSCPTAVVGNPTGSVDYGIPSVGRTAAIQSVCTNATSLAGYLDVFTANSGTLTNRARFSDLGIDIHETVQGIGGLGINNDSGAFLRLMPNMIGGNYNGMVQTGDTALVFSQGTLDSGTIVIGPHTTSVKGLRVTAAGNVGIGVINPTSALAVNGTISAKEVKVVASPADYVFADGYRLPPLAEVEAYITANRHLPGVASAREQEEQGVLIADLMRAHLEKIEELNLYVIQQQKVLDAQARIQIQQQALIDALIKRQKVQDEAMTELARRLSPSEAGAPGRTAIP